LELKNANWPGFSFAIFARRVRMRDIAFVVTRFKKCESNMSQERHSSPNASRVPRMAWDLVRSLADFVSDGCKLVAADEYRRRLEICDGCEERRDNRCRRCGCRLSLKARGRAFRCPLGNWAAAGK